MTGTVMKKRGSAKGFVFLARDGERDVFAHAKSFEPGVFDNLAGGERVEFQVETDPRSGRPQAVRCRLLSGAPASGDDWAGGGW